MALRHTLKYNQYRGNILATPAADKPVTVAELADHLKLSNTDEGDSLEFMLDASISIIEIYLNIALYTQSWDLTLDQWPSFHEPWWDGVMQGSITQLNDRSRAADVLFPIFPLQTVNTILVDGVAVTIADVFIVDTQQKKGRLVLKFGATFPIVTLNSANGIVINYTSGYGTTPSSVPPDIRLAILQLASFIYSHRGDSCAGESALKQSGAKIMVDKYKVMDL